MRDIVFRGKQKDYGEWFIGDLMRSYDSKYWIVTHDTEGNYGSEIVSETVGQFTGLLDKNGKRIFEGDVLRIAKTTDGMGCYYTPPLEYPVNAVVKWDFCAWMWETLCEDKRYISFPNAWCHYECEVIGNIHDNPELLKGE